MSRYHQLYNSTGTVKFQTLLTGAASVTSGAIDARRITISSNSVAHFVAFGTSTVTASTSSFVVPANSTLDFNFVSGQYVAAIAASGSGYISILDSD